MPRKLAVSGHDSPYNSVSYRLIQVAEDSLYHPVRRPPNGARRFVRRVRRDPQDVLAIRSGNTRSPSLPPLFRLFLLGSNALSPCNKRIFTCFDA